MSMLVEQEQLPNGRWTNMTEAEINNEVDQTLAVESICHCGSPYFFAMRAPFYDGFRSITWRFPFAVSHNYDTLLAKVRQKIRDPYIVRWDLDLSVLDGWKNTVVSPGGGAGDRIDIFCLPVELNV